MKALLLAIIILFTVAPSYGSDDGGSDDGGGGCGNSATRSKYADEAYTDFEEAYKTDGPGIILQAGGYTDAASGQVFIRRLLSGTSNRTDVRLPGYSYFQGVIQSDQHLMLAGQVRVVGALLGSEGKTVSLYSGSMVTSNAHAILGASASLSGLPDGIRSRIRSIEEIPTP